MADLLERHRVLKLILDRFDYPLEMDDFDDRHNKQKLVSLLQYANLPLRYRFTWYQYGPYSPDLAKDLFFLAEKPEAATVQGELPGDVGTRVDAVRDLLAANAHDRAFMEAVGSVAFLRKTGLNLDASIHQLRHLKPRLEFNEPALRQFFTQLV